MIKRKIPKDDLEFMLFEDIWALRKEFYDPTTDEEFSKLTKLISELMLKYKNTELENFARDLFIAHAADCEIRFKSNRKRNKK